MKPSVVAALVAIGVAIPACGQAPESGGGNSDQMFREAVYNRFTTAPPFVLVTIVDAQTGMEKTGCTEASALGAAISLQLGWTTENRHPDDQEVTKIIINSPGRRFVFLQELWLVGSGYYSIDHNEKACSFIRRGIPAHRGDISNTIFAGSPGHEINVGRP